MGKIWHDLKGLNKDELVIEYVAERYQLGVFVGQLFDLRDFDIRGTYDPDLLRIPTGDWCTKIAIFAWNYRNVSDLGYCGGDLKDYGVESDTADDVFDEMCDKGTFTWPWDFECSPNHDAYKEYEKHIFDDLYEEPKIEGDWEELCKLSEEELTERIMDVRRRYDELLDGIEELYGRFRKYYAELLPDSLKDKV